MNGFNRSNDSSSNNINRRNFLGRAATGAASALGVGSGLFYKGLIRRADARFDQHLEALK